MVLYFRSGFDGLSDYTPGARPRHETRRRLSGWQLVLHGAGASVVRLGGATRAATIPLPGSIEGCQPRERAFGLRAQQPELQRAVFHLDCGLIGVPVNA